MARVLRDRLALRYSIGITGAPSQQGIVLPTAAFRAVGSKVTVQILGELRNVAMQLVNQSPGGTRRLVLVRVEEPRIDYPYFRTSVEQDISAAFNEVELICLCLEASQISAGDPASVFHATLFLSVYQQEG